ncbi:MAG: endolytic transglycosylase MltG, partial [Dehalococcoidia bacterium]|nr:endolytic transglycosylase MltG [Dehalococcoidia bacterium]
NPGKEAIEAVLFPAKTDYLYFVSKNDGSHHFSKTLVEHNRAVEIYQKKKRMMR